MPKTADLAAASEGGFPRISRRFPSAAAAEAPTVVAERKEAAGRGSEVTAGPRGMAVWHASIG